MSLKNTWIILSLIFGVALPAAGRIHLLPSTAQTAVTAQGDTVSLTNNVVRVTFDFKKGTYTVYRQPGDTPWILDAYAQIATSTTLTGRRFSYTENALSDDPLGAGRRLRIRGEAAGSPDMLLDFTIYDHLGLMTVRAGLRNTSPRPIRLREAYPLRADFAHGGAVFVGPDPGADHRVLTGEGDTWCPQLLGRVNAKSANVMLITHLKQPAKESLVLGGLTTFEFIHRIGVNYNPGQHLTDGGRAGIDAWIRTWDPAGKRIEPGQEYLPDPAMIDFSESNPYTAMEQYARTVAAAMNVHLNGYGAYAPVCMWYVNGTSIGENTTAGALREAHLMKDMGLTHYAPPLVRLVPIVPANPNEQMWWDDEHWLRYGHLGAPMDTIGKWAAAMQEAGAACALTLQPSVPSSDYATSHPGQMLYNNAQKLPDFTDPAYQKHVKEVCRRLAGDGIKALFFDYCGPLLLGADGGFEDRGATAVSAYRKIFALAREGAGKQLPITENPNGRATAGAEAATGLIDAKRSETDKVTLTQRVIKRGIREWYRNRTTKAIDPDVKNFEPYDGDLLHAQVTAMATMFGKTMLGSSVTRYTPEAIHAIGRIMPMPADAATARPVGLFASPDDEGNAPNPEVYTYPLGGDATMLMLWNHSGDRAKAISAPLGGDTAFGGTGMNESLTYDAWDTWDWEDRGPCPGGSTLAALVRPGEMKTIILHPAQRQPYVMATTRHLLPALAAEEVKWDADDRLLKGQFQVTGGQPFKAAIKLPASGTWSIVNRDSILTRARGASVDCHLDLPGRYVELTVNSETTRAVDWSLHFKVASSEKTGNPGPPQDLRAGWDFGEGTVNLKWDASYRVDDRPVRYLIYRDPRAPARPEGKNRIGVTIKTAASDGDVSPGETYFYQVVAEDGSGNRSKPASVGFQAPATASRALLNQVDGETGGNWRGHYGEEGYVMFSVVGGNRDKVQLPSFVDSLSYRGQKGTMLLAGSTADPRALAYDDETTHTRRQGAMVAFQDLYLDLKMKDEDAHAVALYFVNWEGLERRFTIEVLDGPTHRPLTAPYELSGFFNGKYLQFLVRGSVVIKISRPESSNGIVLDGIFFDEAKSAPLAAVKTCPPIPGADGSAVFSWQPLPGAASYRLTVGTDAALARPVFSESGWETSRQVPGMPTGGTVYWKVEATGAKGDTATSEGGVQTFTVTPAVAFVGFDDQTLGNWRARHGKAGYLLPAGNAQDWNDAKNLPPFIESVNTAGSQYYSWINTGTKESPAAPEAPTDGGARNGSAIYDHWYLTVDVKAKDEAEHTISFYNWLGAIYPADGMDAWIEVLDPETGLVLDRRRDRRMLDGIEGRYFTYRFKKRLLLRLKNENGPYCFLNGIFWEN